MRREFRVHKLSDEGLKVAGELAAKFSELADYVEQVGDSNPEKTIAFRKLEEASFYAKKSLAERYATN